jgi:hypothetical protein
MDDVMIYTDRREFLIASVSDGRAAWDDGSAEPEFFGLAKTEHQFRQALCEAKYPTVRKLSKQQMQALMADELKTMATG